MMDISSYLITENVAYFNNSSVISRDKPLSVRTELDTGDRTSMTLNTIKRTTATTNYK